MYSQQQMQHEFIHNCQLEHQKAVEELKKEQDVKILCFHFSRKKIWNLLIIILGKIFEIPNLLKKVSITVDLAKFVGCLHFFN